MPKRRAPGAGGEKERLDALAGTLLRTTGEFCDRYLNREYKQLCDNLIMKMRRKRVVPFATGRIEIWAGAVVYALGQINFLFDRDATPYVSHETIAAHFGVSRTTLSQKARVIRDVFKMGYFDAEFSTRAVQASNPLASAVMVDGLIVPAEMLPRLFAPPKGR